MTNCMRFTFGQGVDPEAIEQDMAMALLVAEFLYGKPRVRLEAGYDIDSGNGSLVIDVSGDSGKTAAQVFAGFCAVRFGEEGYSVEHCGSERAIPDPNGVPS